MHDSCLVLFFFRHFCVYVLHVFSAGNAMCQSVKGKNDVFHSPEPQLSQGTVNHAGVVATSGKLWEGGFRSEPSGGSALLIFHSLWLLV